MLAILLTTKQPAQIAQTAFRYYIDFFAFSTVYLTGGGSLWSWILYISLYFFIHTLLAVFNTIQSGDIDIRSELYKHIVLSGGSSMYPGLPSRLEKEVKQLYLQKVLNGDTSRLSVCYLFIYLFIKKSI